MGMVPWFQDGEGGRGGGGEEEGLLEDLEEI